MKFLLKQDNHLLNKYYCYLRYYCGYSKNNTTDSTALQILSAIGYSGKKGSSQENLSKYNDLLVRNNFISITKTHDERGYNRNIYRIVV
jgi:hypothetical protein